MQGTFINFVVNGILFINTTSVVIKKLISELIQVRISNKELFRCGNSSTVNCTKHHSVILKVQNTRELIGVLLYIENQYHKIIILWIVAKETQIDFP